MGAHASGRRALAGFFLVGPGIVVLFGAVAMVALHPVDGLAWVQVPDLAADLRLDAGLQTKPLKTTVVAEALADQSLEASDSQSLAIPPALALAAPPPTVALHLPPSARPVITPVPTAAPVPTTAPSPAPSPSPAATPPSPSATPTPTPAATPTPTPTPPAPTPQPTPRPTPTPTPRPSPTPTPAPTGRFAITSANEAVSASMKNQSNAGRCNQMTVTATGSFTTNGVGGWVFYQWIHYDTTGKVVGSTPEAPIRVAAGDTSSHAVVPDSFTPQHSGSDKLVFWSPVYAAAAQNWSCVG